MGINGREFLLNYVFITLNLVSMATQGLENGTAEAASSFSNAFTKKLLGYVNHPPGSV